MQLYFEKWAELKIFVFKEQLFEKVLLMYKKK